MANTSILNAFKRMWQHVVVEIDNRINNKISDTGWIDLGCAMGQGFAFYRKFGDMVTVRIDMAAGAYLYGTNFIDIGLGALPENCWPSTTVTAIAWNQYTPEMLIAFNVTSNGKIRAKIANGSDNSSTSAEGLQFSFFLF